MKLLKFFLTILFIISFRAEALELTLYGGALSHTAVSGCCSSSGVKTGGGILGRFDFDRLGQLEFSGYSDGRWTEGLILRPLYVIGQPAKIDTGAGDLVEAQTIANLRWISSVGGGYFSHTTNSRKFDLPVLVTGLTLSNMNQFLYSIDDRWSAAGMLQLTLGWSRSDVSFLLGGYLGVVYNLR